jgi:peptide-methionine (R)-S-oxide reductase
MAAHSGSGFDLTPPSPERRTLLEADLTADGANVLLRHATEAPFCGVMPSSTRISAPSYANEPRHIHRTRVEGG